MALLVAVAALTPASIPPSVAQAGVVACTVGGAAGPITVNQGPETGAESVLEDLSQGNQGDSLLGGADPLTDTGIRRTAAGWEDEIYELHTLSPPAINPSVCLAVDSNGPADDGTADTGLYTAEIHSQGAYDNSVCGTGDAIARGVVD